MSLIYGLDEAGRGAFAGPLVAACVSLKNENIHLKDSKKLRPKKREEIFEVICKNAHFVDVEIIDIDEINLNGIGEANIKIFERLIERNNGGQFLIDGNLKFDDKRIVSIVKADDKIPNVMAASIIAKVTRDRIMQKLHHSFPNFLWYKNKGYGTKEHLEAVKKYGASRHHRIQFINTALSNLGAT